MTMTIDSVILTYGRLCLAAGRARDIAGKPGLLWAGETIALLGASCDAVEEAREMSRARPDAMGYSIVLERSIGEAYSLSLTEAERARSAVLALEAASTVAWLHVMHMLRDLGAELS